MDDLLTQVEAFLDRYEMEATNFGKSALNDSGIVFDLRQGNRKLRKSTRRRILDFMVNYKPERKRA